MTFKHFTLHYVWRIVVYGAFVAATILWSFQWRLALLMNLIVLITIGAALGARKLYVRITRPSCTCCTAGDSCLSKDGLGCERHCRLHGPHTTLPKAFARKRC